MRRRIIAAAVGVTTWSAVSGADALRVDFDSDHDLAGWSVQGVAAGSSGWTIANGELQVATFASWRREVPGLSAKKGWVVEARFAVDLAQDAVGSFQIGAADDLHGVYVSRRRGELLVDQTAVAIKDDPNFHTYRLEVSGGRRRVFVDAALVFDDDSAIAATVPTAAQMWKPELTFGAASGVGDHMTAIRWDYVSIDTAPSGLATSTHKTPAALAVQFKGPLAPLLLTLANALPAQQKQLAALQLPAKARACLVFEVVAWTSSTPPAHLRVADLQRAITKATPKPPPPVESGRHPICDPAGPCDCGRCPAPEPFSVTALRLLVAGLNTTSVSERDHTFDEALDTALGLRLVASPRPDVLQPPPPNIDPARAGILLKRLRALEKAPAACR